MRRLSTTILFVIVSFFTFGQTSEEISVINEINEIRTNPKSYIPKVEAYIKSQEFFINNYDKLNVKVKSTSGNMDSKNNLVNGKTITGKKVFIRNVNVAKELINILDTLTPMCSLTFDSTMYLVTKSHGDYLKSVNKHGHYGPNGEVVFDRLEGFGTKNSENCGSSVIGLMIDAGIPGYGHRYNILNPEWKYISVYVIPNYNKYMVQNFHN